MPIKCLFYFVTFAFFFGCQEAEDEQRSDDPLPACAKASELTITCAEEPWDCVQTLPMTCTYRDIVVETDDCSCSDVIFQAICDAGLEDSVETIQEGLECVTTEE